MNTTHRFLGMALAVTMSLSTTTEVIASPPSACPVTEQTNAVKYAVHSEASGDIVRVTNDGREFEVLRGEAAVGHIRNLRSRHVKGFGHAEKELRRRGYVPTQHAIVIRSVGKAISPVQSVQTVEGEIAFWSWDDGNNATWEGTFYASTYDDGSYVMMDGQIDTNVHDTLWEYTASSEPNAQAPFGAAFTVPADCTELRRPVV